MDATGERGRSSTTAPEPNWNWPDACASRGVDHIVLEAETPESQKALASTLEVLATAMRTLGTNDQPIYAPLTLPHGVRIVAMRTT